MEVRAGRSCSQHQHGSIKLLLREIARAGEGGSHDLNPHNVFFMSIGSSDDTTQLDFDVPSADTELPQEEACSECMAAFELLKATTLGQGRQVFARNKTLRLMMPRLRVIK